MSDSKTVALVFPVDFDYMGFEEHPKTIWWRFFVYNKFRNREMVMTITMVKGSYSNLESSTFQLIDWRTHESTKYLSFEDLNAYLKTIPLVIEK